MARTTQGLYFVKTLDGGPPAMGWAYLKVGTVYYQGQPVRVSNTSGTCIRMATAGTSCYGVVSGDLATSVTTTKVSIHLANQNNVFEVKATGTGLPRKSVVDQVKLGLATVHNYRAILGNSAGGALRVVGFNPDDIAATVTETVRYWVTINTSLFGQAMASVTM